MAHDFVLEVCVETLASALAAQLGGAQRVELCSGLSEGGVTPSAGLIGAVRSRLSIAVYVLVRPRGGDFLYTDDDFDIMLRDVETCGKLGCNGVVIGALQSDGTVDVVRCQPLVDAAHRLGMGVTFHRAIDRSRNLVEALEAVVELGCERVLTSGGRPYAWDGVVLLWQLVELAAGRISVMAGSGITPSNAAKIAQLSGVRELHGTLRSRRVQAMFRNPCFDTDEEYGIWETDVNLVRETISKFENLKI
ncbi:MAG: copper homeostasis protein CutC [Prevotellaceae bacterium]|nr:copper homeostasis protein CutC [Prevotellaceae bacterium]